MKSKRKKYQCMMCGKGHDKLFAYRNMTNEEEIWLRICSIKCFLTFAIHFLSIFDFYVEFVTELLKQETMQDKRKRVREAKKKLKQEVSNDKDERKGKEFTGANI